MSASGTNSGLDIDVPCHFIDDWSLQEIAKLLQRLQVNRTVKNRNRVVPKGMARFTFMKMIFVIGYF